MLAYHGDATLKTRFLAELEWHQQQDKIIQGTYWADGRGCAVGCSINSMAKIARKRLDRQNHALYEEHIGVPRILARLEDGIFEGLPTAQAKAWPLRFARAIRPGADLSGVWPRFAVWLLADPTDGVIRFARTDRQRQAVRQVADLYGQQIEGVAIPERTWRAAASAASAASADAAYAASDAASAVADAADADAASAASDAASAVADAAALARSRVLKELADVVRSHFPTPPVLS